MSPVDLTAMSSLGVTEVLCDCSFCAAHESFGLLINCETVTSLVVHAGRLANDSSELYHSGNNFTGDIHVPNILISE